MQIKPKNVTNLVATGGYGTQGGQSVVYLNDQDKVLWQDMAADGYILQKDIPHAFQPSPT
jgi:hypothetical protein